MREIEVELGIGDVLLVGDRLMTVVDIDGDEVCLRFDAADDPALALTGPPPAK